MNPIEKNTPTVEQPYPHKILTAVEFGQLVDEEDSVILNGFLRFCTKHGLIEKKGNRSTPGVQGKPANLFAIPDRIEVVFWGEQEAEVTEVENTPEIVTESAQPQELVVA